MGINMEPSIGRKIQMFRQMRGWSQETLAERAHLSRQQISLYECDKRDPPAIVLAYIANELHVTPNDLVADYLVQPKPPSADMQDVLDLFRNLGPYELKIRLEVVRAVLAAIDFYCKEAT